MKAPRAKLSFDYRLTGAGWAKGKLRHGKQSMSFVVSYYPGDALGDLTGALVELITEFGEDRETIDLRSGLVSINPDNDRSFAWPGEPWGYIWSLALQVDLSLLIRVEEFANLDEAEEQTPTGVFEAKCHLNDFVDRVVRALDKLLVRHGIVGYRREWETAEFPLARHLALKQYLATASPSRITNRQRRDMCRGSLREDLTLALRKLR